jgi:hypothetical protein
MLAFQLIFHWLGFALVADGLARAGRWKAGWLMLATGASPLFIYYSHTILKDVELASTFIAGFGLIFWYRIQGHRPPLVAIMVSLVLIAYGTLVRHNAVFAFGPLLIYALVDPVRISAARLIVLSCLLAVVAIPVSARVDRDLLRAAPSGVIHELQLFDLAGIAHHSGDFSVFPPEAHLSAAELDRCYTPYQMDSLIDSVAIQGSVDPAAVAKGFGLQNKVGHGACPFVGESVFGPRASPATLWPDKDVAKLWLDAIISHPAAYALHRLKSYNSSTYFFVPARHCRFVPGGGCHETDSKAAGGERPTTPQDIRWDYVRKNVLVWPVVWITLGVCIAVLLRLSSASEELSASRVLILSALGFSLSYAIVGISTELRYYYWPMMAIQTSLIVAFPSLAARVRTMDRAVIACILALILTVAAGFFARLTDNQSLMF